MNTKNTSPKKPVISPTFQASFQIIDDDRISSVMMKTRLESQFPGIEIQLSNNPIILPNYDVYLIDNDFEGESLATTLLREIREINPNALVVAMSSTLDQSELECLVNGGCNAVYNKTRPTDSKPVFEVIENYLNVLQKLKKAKNGQSVSRVINSLQELIEQWNQRLTKDVR